MQSIKCLFISGVDALKSSGILRTGKKNSVRHVECRIQTLYSAKKVSCTFSIVSKMSSQRNAPSPVIPCHSFQRYLSVDWSIRQPFRGGTATPTASSRKTRRRSGRKSSGRRALARPSCRGAPNSRQPSLASVRVRVSWGVFWWCSGNVRGSECQKSFL